jgi:hypothetical protein
MPYIGNPIYQSAFVVDQFSGNGSTTAFTMSVAPAGVTNVLVAISGVLQDPSTYGVVGNTITFSAAPPTGTGNISCRYLGVPASGVVTTAYRTQTEFTATAGQTTFTPPSYTVGFIDVYRNGVLLGSADFTATNGTTVVLTNPATAGDLVETISFLVSSVLNAIPNTAGAVSSSNIVDGAITTAKIANGAVVQADLATGVAGTGPAFAAYANTNTSVNNATFTKIALAVEDFDTANCFASSRFTPNVAGYYQINWGVRAEAVNLVESALYKNGALACTGSTVGAASYASTGSHLIYMNGTTDYVELYAAQYAGSAQNMTGNQNTRLSGFLARAA